MLWKFTVTSGGVNVLGSYERIGVQEVWFWEDGLITIHALRSDSHELIPRSELLPPLDIRSVELHTRMADQFDAINSFMNELQQTSGQNLIDRHKVPHLKITTINPALQTPRADLLLKEKSVNKNTNPHVVQYLEAFDPNVLQLGLVSLTPQALPALPNNLIF